LVFLLTYLHCSLDVDRRTTNSWMIISFDRRPHTLSIGNMIQITKE